MSDPPADPTDAQGWGRLGDARRLEGDGPGADRAYTRQVRASAQDPELIAGILRARRLMKAYADVDPDDRIGARQILVELLGSIGNEVAIRSPLYVDYGSQITVGARVQ